MKATKVKMYLVYASGEKIAVVNEKDRAEKIAVAHSGTVEASTVTRYIENGTKAKKRIAKRVRDFERYYFTEDYTACLFDVPNVNKYFLESLENDTDVVLERYNDLLAEELEETKPDEKFIEELRDLILEIEAVFTDKTEF